MEGTVLAILILALIHSCTSCTEIQPYTCYKLETTPVVTVSWCAEFWNLFRCKEEHTSTKIVADACHRTVCCDGYMRYNSWEETCKAVCFGSYTCPNGGSCVAPNKCMCPSGYVSPNCEDENECSVKNGGCSNNCENTEGSYHCTCPRGFTLDSNKLTCKAIATTIQTTTPGMCEEDSSGCSHFCSVVNETRQCTCPAQMELAEDNVTCIDVGNTHVDEVVPFYNTWGFYCCLCIVPTLLLLIAIVLLAKERYGSRLVVYFGYRKVQTEEKEPFLIANGNEYRYEFDGNDAQKPPPYTEKMDELDHFI